LGRPGDLFSVTNTFAVSLWIRKAIDCRLMVIRGFIGVDVGWVKFWVFDVMRKSTLLEPSLSRRRCTHAPNSPRQEDVDRVPVQQWRQYPVREDAQQRKSLSADLQRNNKTAFVTQSVLDFV
jgi:hypothetical protein